jgi:hypothetical protein
VAFWVCKLKPLAYREEPKGIPRRRRVSTLNEILAILTGLDICNVYHDDFTLENIPAVDVLSPPDGVKYRLFNDWVHGLRYHSHSTYSLILAFELIVSQAV